MYDSLKKKFHTVSRASDMNIWYKFMAFKIKSNAPTAGIAAHLRDLYTNLKAINVWMSSDAFLGFVLQAEIMSSNIGFWSSFEQRVEQTIQLDEKPQMSLLRDAPTSLRCLPPTTCDESTPYAVYSTSLIINHHRTLGLLLPTRCDLG